MSRSTDHREAIPTDLDTGFLKTCCADLWSHPGVRLLAGEHLHPGGRALSDRALDLLDLPRGSRLLDLGSGHGAGAALAARRGLAVVALDLSAPAAAEADATLGVEGVVADAERLPLRDGAVHGVLAECVLSAVPDKESAVEGVRRAIRPGGSLLLTDVTREGALPAELDPLIGWVACVGGALSSDGYASLLEGAGFEVGHAEDHGEALAALVAQVRRRLALLQGAVATGVVHGPDLGVPVELLELAQHALELAGAAADEGILSYGLLLARG